MKSLVFAKTKILSRQILLSFIDLNRAILPIFDKRNVYRLPFKQYDKFRQDDKQKFAKEIYRLQQDHFVKKFYEDDEPYLELTDKGKNIIKRHLTENLTINKPETWDKKWRLVIFDIPNEKKNCRDIIRHKLERIGFVKLQESVYVFPFDCLNEINLLKGMYYLSPHIQYIVATHIETEINLIRLFLDNNVLKKNMI